MPHTPSTATRAVADDGCNGTADGGIPARAAAGRRRGRDDDAPAVRSRRPPDVVAGGGPVVPAASVPRLFEAFGGPASTGWTAAEVPGSG